MAYQKAETLTSELANQYFEVIKGLPGTTSISNLLNNGSGNKPFINQEWFDLQKSLDSNQKGAFANAMRKVLHFDTLGNLRRASKEKIFEIKGVAEKTANFIFIVINGVE